MHYGYAVSKSGNWFYYLCRFPLFIRGKEKCQFEFGVFLLNKNIAQVRMIFSLRFYGQDMQTFQFILAYLLFAILTVIR